MTPDLNRNLVSTSATTLDLVTSLRRTWLLVLSRAVAEHVNMLRTRSSSLIRGVGSRWDVYTKTLLMRSLYVFISLSNVVLLTYTQQNTLDLALLPERWKHPWQRGFTCWRSPPHFIRPHWAGLKGWCPVGVFCGWAKLIKSKLNK